MKPPQKTGGSRWLRSKTGLVLLAFLAIAAFFLITEHTAHSFGFLPYALLAVSLLLFLFMRRGQDDSNQHDGHHSKDGQ